MSDFEARDVRNQPAYGLAEAARYLRLPVATLRSWVVGRRYPRADGSGHFEALIEPTDRTPATLSFWNLIEAHVLRSLRTDHGVSIQALRSAIAYAESELSVNRLLLDHQLRTSGGKLLLDRYGSLIDLSASGQIAMRKMFEAHLDRVEWDDWQFPIRLFPFVASPGLPNRPIAINASIAFGRPTVARAGVTTEIMADRIDAGESVADLAVDYDLTPAEIEEAVLYQRAA